MSKYKTIKGSNIEKDIYVDADLFDELSKYNWTIITTNKYTQYAVRFVEGKKLIYMHRHIMKLDKRNKRKLVHHVNHNGLDNRKSNLQIMTVKEHSQQRVFSEEGRKNISRSVKQYWKEQREKM